MYHHFHIIELFVPSILFFSSNPLYLSVIQKITYYHCVLGDSVTRECPRDDVHGENERQERKSTTIKCEFFFHLPQGLSCHPQHSPWLPFSPHKWNKLFVTRDYILEKGRKDMKRPKVSSGHFASFSGAEMAFCAFKYALKLFLHFYS